MRPIHVALGVAACLSLLAGCGKEQSAAAPATVAKKAAVETIPPYTYSPPVKGHYKEINLGEFDVVDGVAYPAGSGIGTVVYVTEKPIASPMIAGSTCPMTQARALTTLRNSRYLEVTLDKGVSKYFAAGSAFNGSSYETEVGSHYWTSRMKADAERAVGNVTHKREGSFDFDLPRSTPGVRETSVGDREKSLRGDPAAPKPTQAAVNDAYVAVHDAAVKKNLKALLAALGFDDKQNLAIRGLEGIDADLVLYSDRFLLPGPPGEFTAKAGTAHVRVEGANAKGKKFVNYYYFSPCGNRLVLDGIAENPQ
jgi:hypothetical protein